jgi:hypothetical protein
MKSLKVLKGKILPVNTNVVFGGKYPARMKVK